MKICLIHPPQPNSLDDRLDIPLGQLYLAAVLKQTGYEVKIADLSSIQPDKWQEIIGWADIYGFTVYTTSYGICKKILAIVKQINPASVTVAGGAHASALPEETLNDFDYVVIGEGELALRELVISLDEGKPMDSRIIKYPLMDSLDMLPYPALDLIDLHSYDRLVDGQPSLSFITSRGCPNSCAFCCNFMFGKRIRYRSIDNVANELALIKSKYGVRNFIFYDDTITLDKKRVKKIAERFKELDIRFRANGTVRVNELDVYRDIYTAGCRNIAFGVETGSQTLLQKMKKNTTVDQIRKAIKNAKEAGLIVKVFLIVGFPGETYQTIQETADLMLECRPHQYTLFNFVPFPGSDVWNNPQNYGISYFEKDYSQYFNIAGRQEGGLTVETENMKRDDVKKMRESLLASLSKLKWCGDVQNYQHKLQADTARR